MTVAPPWSRRHPGDTRVDRGLDPLARLAQRFTRRRFVVGSAGVAVLGVAADGVLAGCSGPTAPAPGPPKVPVPLTVNAEQRQVPVDTRTALLDMLDERLGLTGTKKGCNQGAVSAGAAPIGRRP